MRVSPGAYQITTGAKHTSESAAEGVFPSDASVVCVKTERWGLVVRYTHLIDYTETEAA